MQVVGARNPRRKACFRSIEIPHLQRGDRGLQWDLSLGEWVRDLLLYVGIAVGLVAGILALAVYAPNVTHAQFVFVFMTLILETMLVRMYWPFRKSGKVWLVLGILLLIHIGAYVSVLRYIEDVPILSYFLTIPAEVMITAAITKIWLNVLPTKVKF
jgi:hypothetical protein